MNLNDFIKMLKISILIDLGMYSMALIKNRFDFSQCGYFKYTKFVSIRYLYFVYLSFI